MRFLSRSDRTLVIGLLASTVILFRQPLRSLLDFAYEIESLYQLDLVPALVVLCVVVLFHQVSKHHQTKLEKERIIAKAEQTQARMSEVTRLLMLAQALTNVLDWSALKAVLQQQLPHFVDQRDCWVLLPSQGGWEPFLEPIAASATLSPEQIEALARQGEENSNHADRRGEMFDYGSWPMRHRNQTIGLVIVRHDPPLSQADTQALSSVTALVTTATSTVRLFADLNRSKTIDTLTGCVGREHGLMRLASEFRRARRLQSPLTVMMLDIDTFKAVNDQYGHLVGDTLLAAIGKALARTLRTSDVHCRYGGDEFLIVLPETPLDGAIHVADGLRRAIAELAIPANGHTLRITASLGVSGIRSDELNPLDLVARADNALYNAKRAGRNQYHVAEPPNERADTIDVEASENSAVH